MVMTKLNDRWIYLMEYTQIVDYERERRGAREKSKYEGWSVIEWWSW